MILKMILKSFEFLCDFDFDFQITTYKMIWILILNHLYLGDLILILKSSTYDDFAHLCQGGNDGMKTKYRQALITNIWISKTCDLRK